MALARADTIQGDSNKLRNHHCTIMLSWKRKIFFHLSLGRINAHDIAKRRGVDDESEKKKAAATTGLFIMTFSIILFWRNERICSQINFHVCVHTVKRGNKVERESENKSPKWNLKKVRENLFKLQWKEKFW